MKRLLNYFTCVCCRVATTEKNICNAYNHYVEKDLKYIVYKYYEKVKERHGNLYMNWFIVLSSSEPFFEV